MQLAPSLKLRPLAAALGLAAAALAAVPAHADLVFAPSVSVQGTGLGAVQTLVTVNERNNDLDRIESGCVSSTGGATFNQNCLAGLLGGDNQAQNQTRLLSTVTTDARDIAAVVNLNEPGNDGTATLTDLYLSLYGTGGNLLYTFMYMGADLPLLQTSGIGGSGSVFVLDAAQQAIALSLCPDTTQCYIGGGFQFAEGTTQGGIETLYLAAVDGGGGGNTVPEPSTLALLGLGMLGAVGASRRQKKGA